MSSARKSGILCSECKQTTTTTQSFQQYNDFFCSRPCLLKRRAIELEKQRIKEEMDKQKPKYNLRTGDAGGCC